MEIEFENEGIIVDNRELKLNSWYYSDNRLMYVDSSGNIVEFSKGVGNSKELPPDIIVITSDEVEDVYDLRDLELVENIDFKITISLSEKE